MLETQLPGSGAVLSCSTLRTAARLEQKMLPHNLLDLGWLLGQSPTSRVGPFL